MKQFVNLEDGSNLTEISPVLTCIHTLNESTVLREDRSQYVNSLSLKQLTEDTEVSKEDGFGFAVSLRDGLCFYTSEAMASHLGYPKDMLEGQCFMNILHHKDHVTFANHLTQGLNACFIQGKKDDSHLELNKFFCRIKIYHNLKLGESASSEKILYKPFKIILHINEMVADDVCIDKPSRTLCVKATATRVSPAYTVPEEIPTMTSFSTRHTASCHFSHIDASAIPYVGHLPQDMIGFSVFDFYHIEDMPQLKDIYELVVKERGSPFRSKPYRFKVQNGCYILLETEWSCFINPWSHKLEFVVGQHRVLKGPFDVDIFTPSEKAEIFLPDEIIKESQNIQEEIRSLLSQGIEIFQAKKSKRYCNKRKRVLMDFAYNRFDDDPKGNKQKGNAKKQLQDDDAQSNSDSDSVMGDISPYREANDSSFASETPPTVQQLRFQENIDRFFASEPKTYSDGSDEYNKNEKLSSIDHSQVSSSGSGNGSGNTSASKCEQSPPSTSKNYKNNNQQNGSNSSTFTTGDSGFGKGSGKDGNTNDPSVSQAGSSKRMWTKGCPNNWTKICPNDRITNIEKFSSCLALTEQSLSAHNRINHKHFKQQRKNKTSLDTAILPLRDNWFQQKDSAKHKKSTQTQILKISTPTQTDEKLGTEQTPVPNFQDKSVSPSNVIHPFMFPSVNPCGPTPTPFYIPVMYMGCMPCFPPSSSAPHWPFGSAPPPTPSTEPSQKPKPSSDRFHFPNLPNASGCIQPDFPKFSDDKSFNQPSNLGVKSFCAPIVPSITPTVNSECGPALQKSRGNYAHLDVENKSVLDSLIDVENQNLQNKPDPVESDMQVEESPSSSFTRTSSFQSADKDEDMDCEKDKPCSATHSNKVELTAEIAYRYQMSVPSMEDILKKDREVLKSMQQPDLVNQQLLMLQGERETENEVKLKVDEEDFCMTEDVMLGLATDHNVNDELEYREECLLQLMCED